MNKTQIAAQIEIKQARYTALKANEHIAMMSDDFYYRNGGDTELRQLAAEIAALRKELNREEIPTEVLAKAAEMYYAYNKGVLEGAGESITDAWVKLARKELGS